MTHPDARTWFWYGCLFELGIGLTGLGITAARGRLSTLDFTVSYRSILVGVAATGPLLAAMVWTMRTRCGMVREIQEVIVRRALPVFRKWSTVQLAVVSALAGVGEEMLFRFAVQGWLEGRTGPAAAILIAGLIFGLCHFINLPYALFTAMAGFYLGMVFYLTDNLIPVAVAHAVYDFVALVYLVRTHQQQPDSRDVIDAGTGGTKIGSSRNESEA
mgnify:CR=1 FL=1